MPASPVLIFWLLLRCQISNFPDFKFAFIRVNSRLGFLALFFPMSDAHVAASC